MDTLKRELKKAYSLPTKKSLQQFLQLYRITANPNILEARSPAEATFARKIRLVFEKLLPKQTLQNRTSTVPLKRFNLGDKVYFKHFRNNVSFWELGTITQRIGNVTYIIQGPKFEYDRHLNQIRKRTTEDLVDLLQEEEEATDTVYDTFDIDPPQTMPEPRRSGRKRKFTDPLLICPKKKRYWFHLSEQSARERGVVAESPTNRLNHSP